MSSVIVRNRGKAAGGRLLIYFLLTVAAIYFLLPVLILVNTGLKSFKEVNIYHMWWLPGSPSFEAFYQALSKLAPNLLNSFMLTIPASLISAMLGSINGYVLSKWKFRGSNIVFILILFGMFIPYQSILIPLVQFLSRTKLYGKLVGLILTHVIYGIPITTLIFKNYYSEVPTSLLESGLIDGVGILGGYWRLILPVSAPAFVVVIIWQFTSIWNEFLFAVSIIQNPNFQPITVALQNLAGSEIIEWNIQMAGALLAALPTLLVYIFLGKYFIRGLLAGSIKG
jgi:glucose/mannose transport system permease protein